MEKIRLDFHVNPLPLKHEVLIFLKNNDKMFMNVVCCSRDWRFMFLNSIYVQLNDTFVCLKLAYHGHLQKLKQKKKKNT